MPPTPDELGSLVGAAPSDAELPLRLEHWRNLLNAQCEEVYAGVRPFASLRDGWLSRKSGLLGRLNEEWLKPATADRKRAMGAAINELRQHAEARIQNLESRLAGAARAARQESERIDISLPGRPLTAAPLHPVSRVMEEMVGIFARLGYSVADGPEIESPYYNFEALNIPETHPARDDQDTLYLDPAGWLLRSHTSPVQIRTMKRQPPPLRVVAPGRVYRRDAPDASHSPMFHQLEGLAVDTDLTLRDLKGTLDHFAREMFGSHVHTRFRPSYFQFTEPSAEMDVSCIFCRGAGCRTCKHSGWLEILGCGMVNPAVYPFVGYDPEAVTGFAFGMGVERIAMIRYDVDDLQRFFSGELRFLEQFRD